MNGQRSSKIGPSGTHYYVYSPDGLLLSENSNGTCTNCIYFGSEPVAETNSAGTVTRVERYTPYGEPADMQLDAGPGFTGHATDVATGLTYMQQRYYDADIGRLISPDPIGPNPNDGALFNRYWYADNNPIKNIDPDGRCTGTHIKSTCEGGGSVAGLATSVAGGNQKKKGQEPIQQNFSAGGGSENKPANESDDASDDGVVDQVLNFLEKFKDLVVN